MVAAIVVGAALGYLTGGLVYTARIGAWSETLKRYLYKIQGGGGEGLNWGEPMFYGLLLMVLPTAWTVGGALLGAAAAMLSAAGAARAGGLWPLVQRHVALIAVSWTVLVGLTGWFAYVQWVRAREDVARYRSATGAPAVVVRTPEPVRTVDALQKACALRDGWSCFTVGVKYERADGVPRDFARAAAFYQKACDVPYAIGCVYLGDSYLHGEGVARDDARAVSLYVRGAALLQQDCERGDAYGCYALGTMYRTGQGVGADVVRAKRLFEQACRAGNKDACAAGGGAR